MIIKELKANEVGFGLLKEHDAGFILRDLTDNNKKLFESLDKGEIKSVNKVIHIDCILQKADVLNRNGRVYPYDILKREDEKYQVLINNKNAFGECDHPDGIKLSLKDISHNVIKTWWVNNNNEKTLWGTLELIMSDGFIHGGVCSVIGDKIALYLQRGYKIGISSRAIGSVRSERGKNIVQSDLDLICYDLVATPSTPNAYLFMETATIAENTDLSIKNNFYEQNLIKTLNL